MALMLSSAAYILLNFKDYTVFFITPSDIASLKDAQRSSRLRLGGLVKTGSVSQAADGTLSFTVTDGTQDMQVRYRGIIPSLFREGQGVVAEGMLEGADAFRAETILAKHDENYMPKEVVDALKKSGKWQDKNAP